jgi:putative endonuclease
MFWVYVLQNPDGKLYIGQTDDLRRRSQQHNDPAHILTRTTKRFRGPWKVVYSEEAPSRSAALVREKALKSGQGRAWLKAHLGC